MKEKEKKIALRNIQRNLISNLAHMHFFIMALKTKFRKTRVFGIKELTVKVLYCKICTYPLPCYPEVSNFDNFFIVRVQHVFGLQITVYNATVMKKLLGIK